MIYTVKPGDTLGKIAVTFYGKASLYTKIAAANHIQNPNQIHVGQTLEIPDTDGDLLTAPPATPEQITTPQDSPSDNAALVNSEQFNKAQLSQIMPQARENLIDLYLDGINDTCADFEINTPLRKAQFIAQVGHESGYLRYHTENLNYSSKALSSVFGKYFPTQALAEAYARQPEKIANRVYANRMGNGDETSGDGWAYRGRGLIQLTGKNNYQACSDSLNVDLVVNPEQAAENPILCVKTAGWFWNSRDLNNLADQDDIVAITKKINGGTNGLEDRQAILQRAKQVLGI